MRHMGNSEKSDICITAVLEKIKQLGKHSTWRNKV